MFSFFFFFIVLQLFFSRISLLQQATGHFRIYFSLMFTACFFTFRSLFFAHYRSRHACFLRFFSLHFFAQSFHLPSAPMRHIRRRFAARYFQSAAGIRPRRAPTVSIFT